MKLLGTAFFFLAVLSVCTVGEDDSQTTTVKTTTSAVTSKAVEPETTATSQTTTTTTVPAPVLTTTAARTTQETSTSSPMPSSPNATSQTTQGITEKPTTATSAATTSLSTTNITQASGAQLAQNESLDSASTMGQSFSSTVSPKANTSASGTPGLPMISPTTSTKPTSESPKSSSGNQTHTGSNISYSNVILPIVITLIVITLSVFSLVALYKMCQKKTPERQENGAEQAQSDKDGVKLLSVKTTSSETACSFPHEGATSCPLLPVERELSSCPSPERFHTPSVCHGGLFRSFCRAGSDKNQQRNATLEDCKENIGCKGRLGMSPKASMRALISREE